MIFFVQLHLLTKRLAHTVYHRVKLPRLMAVLLASLQMTPAAFAQGEWLAFTDVTATLRDLPASFAGKMEEQEIKPSLTLFGNLDKEHYQALFEGVISSDEAEIERLQLGWNLNQMNTLWFGRFHNPFDYWTSKYHHGLYFQTTQLRPGIVEFEDEGGVMPMHLSGFLLEGLHLTRGMAGIRYDLALAVGPRVVRDSDGSSVLEAPTVTSPFEKNKRHRPAISARLAYLPDAAGEQEIGLFLSRDTMPTEGLDFIHSNVVQTTGGLFGNWENERFKAFGAAIFIRHQLEMTMAGVHRKMSHTIGNQYLQGEYLFRPNWRSYSRLEFTQGSDDDAYIQSFAMFIKKRFLLGVRHDFHSSQALKLEVSRAEHQHGDAAFNALSLQWSAMFP